MRVPRSSVNANANGITHVCDSAMLRRDFLLYLGRVAVLSQPQLPVVLAAFRASRDLGSDQLWHRLRFYRHRVDPFVRHRRRFTKQHLLPDESTIFAWIEEVFSQGIRRPGYPADRWAEAWLQDQFRAVGLERVRAEPVTLPYWEDRAASLTVTAGGIEFTVPCFPFPIPRPQAIFRRLSWLSMPMRTLAERSRSLTSSSTASRRP